jgi:hypothetical protein
MATDRTSQDSQAIETNFTELGDWEATRSTLHLYSRILSAVANVHAEPHPKWWHVSLNVQSDGLMTEKMDLPQNGSFTLGMNFDRHQIVLANDSGPIREFDMAAGLTATEMSDQILGAVADLGLTGDYPSEKFESDELRTYDPVAAERFFDVLLDVNRLFDQHRATLPGDVSPINFWTHGFDLAFEWYGTRRVESTEGDTTTLVSSQLNLGFYPATPAYFYSNAWPFEGDQFLDRPLPDGASWHTDGWEGAMLPYAELVGDERADERVLTFARRVYELSAPTLNA